MDANTLLEVRKKAQAAVADMPDGELKLKAFELILNRLLAAEDTGAPSSRGRARQNRQGKARSESKSTASARVGAVSDSAPARVLMLKEEGYFKEQRGIGEIRDELQTRGWIYDVTALSGPLMKLLHAGELRRRKAQDGNKAIYKYFNP